LDDLHRLAAPFRTLLGAVLTPPSRARAARARTDETAPDDVAGRDDLTGRDDGASNDDARPSPPRPVRGGWPHRDERSSDFA
jgi:hypothetical protein